MCFDKCFLFVVDNIVGQVLFLDWQVNRWCRVIVLNVKVIKCVRIGMMSIVNRFLWLDIFVIVVLLYGCEYEFNVFLYYKQ